MWGRNAWGWKIIINWNEWDANGIRIYREL